MKKPRDSHDSTNLCISNVLKPLYVHIKRTPRIALSTKEHQNVKCSLPNTTRNFDFCSVSSRWSQLIPALVSKFIHSSPKLIPDCILTILTLVWYVWKWLCSCCEDSLDFNWSKCASHTTGAPPFVLCLSWPFFLSWRAFPLVSSSRTLQDIFERSVVSFLQWGIVFLLDFLALSREGSSWCLLSCHFRVKRVQNYASICTHSSPVILWKVLSTWRRLQCVEGAAEKSNSAESLAILRPTQITSQIFQS